MKRARTSREILLLVLLAAATASGASAAAEPTRWTCSMHPQIILPDNSQQCPLCFMDLIPLEEETGAGLDPSALTLSEVAVALAEIETGRVERRPATKRIPLVGRIEPDPNRVRTITARFGGRLDRLHAAVTGLPVERGVRLAEIYSPELYSAQAELRVATAAWEESRAAGRDGADEGSLLESVRSRLRLWGLDEAEIGRLRDGLDPGNLWPVHAPTDGVILSLSVAEGDYVETGAELYRLADLTAVWAVLEAFESDVVWLQPGQSVEFTARAHPGRRFTGSILLVEPVLNPRTRTVAVRVEVENPDGMLKPGMLLSAVAQAAVGPRGEPGTTGAQPLLIPASAPLLTGERAVVYVRKPGQEPVFVGREIVLGPRAGDSWVVIEGLVAGEEVVTRGSFKIDSALQIQARPSMMNRGGSGMSPGHGHGGHGGLTEHADPVGDSHPPAPTDDEADWGDGAILTHYFALQTALAADDDEEAAAAARKLLTVLEALPADGDDAWTIALKELRPSVAAVANRNGIAARRLAFQPLSDRLWAAVTVFGPPAGRTVRRFHCPMAMDGAGADWIQDGKTVANPYYGVSMLRCGAEVEALAGGHDAEAR